MDCDTMTTEDKDRPPAAADIILKPMPGIGVIVQSSLQNLPCIIGNERRRYGCITKITDVP